MFKPGFLLKPWGGDAKKPRAYKVSHWTDKKNVMLFLAKVQNPATNAIDIRHLIGSFVLSRGIVRQTHEALMLLDDPYRRGIELDRMKKYETMGDFALPAILDKVFEVKDDKIQAIDLWIDHPHIDLVIASTFRCAGLYATEWRSCTNSPGIPHFPPNLPFFRNLEVIDVQQTTRVPKMDFPDLSMLSKIRCFELGNYPLQGPFPQWIHKWKNLKSFCICNTYVEGQIPDSIGQCTNLIRLCVQRTNVSEVFPPGLMKCTKLISLKAVTNKRDSRLRRLDQVWNALPDLRVLTLRVNVPLNQVDFSCIADRKFDTMVLVSPIESHIRPTVPQTTATGMRIWVQHTPKMITISTSPQFPYNILII